MTIPLGILSQGASTNYGYWLLRNATAAALGDDMAVASNGDVYLYDTAASDKLLKVSNAGSVLVKKQLAATFLDIKVDSSNNVFLLGGTYYWKFDSSLNLQWVKADNTGGENYDQYLCDAVGDGGMVFAGNFSTPSVTFNGFVRKISTTGTVSWTKAFTDPAGAMLTLANPHVVPGGTDVYVWGALEKPAGTLVPIVGIKFNSAGTVQWTRQFPTAGLDGTIGSLYSAIDSAGNTFLGVSDYYQTRLTKINASGTIVWTRQFPAGTSIRDISVGADGNIYVLTSSYHVKMDTNASIIWTRKLTGTTGSDTNAAQVAGDDFYFLEANALLKADSANPQDAILGPATWQTETNPTLTTVTVTSSALTLTTVTPTLAQAANPTVTITDSTDTYTLYNG